MITESIIKNSIKSLVESTSNMNPDEALEKFSTDLAKIITDAIKSADVQAGIAVQVTLPTGTGTTTSTGSLL